MHAHILILLWYRCIHGAEVGIYWKTSRRIRCISIRFAQIISLSLSRVSSWFLTFTRRSNRNLLLVLHHGIWSSRKVLWMVGFRKDLFNGALSAYLVLLEYWCSWLNDDVWSVDYFLAVW